jgi:hypothetical protein
MGLMSKINICASKTIGRIHMKWLIQSVACLIAVSAAALVHAQSDNLKSLVPALKQGGYVLVVRHGATDSAQTDIYPLSSDMTKQRQLSEPGREVAKQIGAAFKKLGVPIGNVYTSQLNRAVETGKLVAGKNVTAKQELNDSSMGSTSAMAGPSGGGSKSHGEALRTMASTSPLPATNTIIVTHKTNVLDAFGQEVADIKEGEALVFKPDASGNPHRVARVQASDWTKVAGGG